MAHPVELALRHHPVVDECRFRESDVGGRGVLYIVTRTDVAFRDVVHELRAYLPEGFRDIHCVPVWCIPRDRDGVCDDAALARIPVIDADVLSAVQANLEAELQSEVAVMLRERTPSAARWHLGDILPGWSSSLRADAPTTARSSEDAGAPLAVTTGPRLQVDPGAPRTLPEALERAAANSGAKGLVYLHEAGASSQTYAELLEAARRLAARLEARGLKPQDKVILQLADNRAFVTALWACLIAGLVPVPLAPARDYSIETPELGKLTQAWQLLDRPLILTSRDRGAGIESATFARDAGGVTVAVFEDDGRADDRDVGRAQSPRPEDLALLLFTSGSTGVPKAVMLSHGNIIAMAAGTSQMNAFSSRDVALNWMPLDHVGAIVFLHAMCVYLGSAQVHAPKELVLADVGRWLQWIHHYRATISWAPNFAFKLVIDGLDPHEPRAWDLSCMRFLVNAGEMIVARTARQFLQALARFGLPRDAIRPAFGMSETCSGITWSHAFSLDSTNDETRFVELGGPIPGASLRIVDDDGRLLREGQAGRLQVHGPSVTAGYHANSAATAAAMTSDGWFDTGDVAVLKDGKLTLTGRKKDAIIVRGVNYDAHHIEAVVEEAPGVLPSYTAACSVVDARDEEQLAIFFAPRHWDDAYLGSLVRRIRADVVAKVGVNPRFLLPLHSEEVPKTAIGKVQRGLLKARLLDGALNATVRRIDSLLQVESTIPANVYAECWQVERLRSGANTVRAGSWLVLAPREVAGRLAGGLKGSGARAVAVRFGATFERVSAAEYVVDPADPGHLAALFGALENDRVAVDHVVNWHADDGPASDVVDAALAERCGSEMRRVVMLIQNLARHSREERRIGLNVVTGGVHAPSDAGALHGFVLPGLLGTIRAELPWLGGRQIDFDSAEPSVQAILDELTEAADAEDVVVRGERRFVRRFRRVELQELDRSPSVRPDGVYLITGGLGEIGLEVAQLLLERYRAKLLVIGRSPADAPRVVAALARLQDGAPNVLYRSVDVADRGAVLAAVEEAERRWSPLAGVFHLAGIFPSAGPMLGEQALKTPDVLRAKVEGTVNLAHLLETRRDATLVCFGSIAGVFGHPQMSAYAAANSFQDRFCAYLRARGHRGVQSISWPMWRGVGLAKEASRGVQDAMAVLGYPALTSSEALNFLAATLRCPEPNVVIGLDASRARIRRHLVPPFLHMEEVVAFTAESALLAGTLSSSATEVKDRSGRVSACALRVLPALPRDAAGAVDYAALRSGPEGARAYVAPRTPVESAVAEIWKEVLDVDLVAIADSFFDLGGDSLLAAKVVSRVSALFPVRVSLADLFDAPTLRGFSDKIDSLLLDQISQMTDEQAEALNRSLQPSGPPRV
jgi:acyl-CoA synthetase (AMP-forming)/AMP-acid ligase II/NADP-dependent 3-hydroxy acid dehydrogenase YdfG/acyl carrier protein